MTSRRDGRTLAGSLLAIGAVVAIYERWLHVTNPLIAGFTFLIVVLVAAANADFATAATVAMLATLAFNFFFLPPIGTLYLSDPQNWVALVAFLTVGLVASHLSTTARTRAQEALDRQAQLLAEREAAELARRNEETKSALLASLAHDLRTPLTAIRVAVGNLLAPSLDSDDRREQGDLVLVEVARLQRLFQNVLDMARIEAGAVAAEPRWTHPAEIVAAARDLADVALRTHPVVVRVEGGRVVRLDPRPTATALSQLLENAAQYSPAWSPIIVEARVASEGLVIEVQDRGPGIAPDDLPHIFERFYRGRSAARRATGTGMGLAIARGLIAAMHGRVVAENGPDVGARLTITVPAPHRATIAPEPTA